jgi:hypothetical protein
MHAARNNIYSYALFMTIQHTLPHCEFLLDWERRLYNLTDKAADEKNPKRNMCSAHDYNLAISMLSTVQPW